MLRVLKTLFWLVVAVVLVTVGLANRELVELRVLPEALAKGNRVELRGFGAFSVKRRDGRTGRNPRTGEAVEVDEKHVPFFKTGKLLRERLNGGTDPGPDDDDE